MDYMDALSMILYQKRMFSLQEAGGRGDDLLGPSARTVGRDRIFLDKEMDEELKKRLENKWIVIEFDATTMKHACTDRHLLAVIAHFVEDGRR
jgi:hypothetical protein